MVMGTGVAVPKKDADADLLAALAAMLPTGEAKKPTRKKVTA